MKFLQPTTLQELAQCLAQKSGPDCYLVAGATDFLAKRNGKAWDAKLLVSLVNVPALRVIQKKEQVLSIGAACTHTQVETHPVVASYFPALSTACGDIGSKQIRNRGTVGGSIGNASPAGDIYPVMIVLGAQAVLINGLGTTRCLPVEKLILGKEKTILAEDEAIVSFELPLPPANNRNAFVKLGERLRVTIAKINMAASIEVENGVSRNVKIAMGAVGERAFFSASAGVLEGKRLSAELLPAFYCSLSNEIEHSIPNRASMPYKRQAVQGMADDLLSLLLLQQKKKV